MSAFPIPPVPSESELSRQLSDQQRAAAGQLAELEADRAARQLLAAERDRLQLQLDSCVPREQHQAAVDECRR